MVLSLISGAASGIGNYLGAKAQAKEAKKNRKFQQRIYNEGVERASPWVNAGMTALDQYGSSFGAPGGGNALASFYESPEYLATYNAAMEAADREIGRMGSAGGKLNSGNRIIAAQDRAGRLGGDMMGNYLARLFNMSEAGRGAASGVNTFTGNQGARVGRAMGDVGAASAAGYMGIGNTIGNTLEDYMQGRAMQSTSGYSQPDFRRLY